MKYLYTVLLLIIFALFALALVNSSKSDQGTIGGASIWGGAYFATTTDIGWGVTNNPNRFRVLKLGGGVLGSVVITDATAGTFTLYDATTTNSIGAAQSTTTLAIIAASAAETTYIYDIGFTKGLIVEFNAGNVASSTITWQ